MDLDQKPSFEKSALNRSPTENHQPQSVTKEPIDGQLPVCAHLGSLSQTHVVQLSSIIQRRRSARWALVAT